MTKDNEKEKSFEDYIRAKKDYHRARKAFDNAKSDLDIARDYYLEIHNRRENKK